jgi:hypothetical protein
VQSIKYNNLGVKSNGKVWCGMEQGRGSAPWSMRRQWAERCSDADHIRQDIDQYNKDGGA